MRDWAKEKEARDALDKSQVEDIVFRSLGILKNARLLNSSEMQKHISNLRLGVSMGLLDEVKISSLNTINTDLQAASITAEYPENTSPAQRDRFRAEKIREILR